MFHMPMSSPMMTRMLGCLAGACATAAVIDSAAARPTTAARHFRNKFFIGLPVWGIRRLAGLREAFVLLRGRTTMGGLMSPTVHCGTCRHFTLRAENRKAVGGSDGRPARAWAN